MILKSLQLDTEDNFRPVSNNACTFKSTGIVRIALLNKSRYGTMFNSHGRSDEQNNNA